MELVKDVAACAIVYDHEKKSVLMGLRGDCNKWSFAGGKAEPQDVGDCYTARRELAEEFGLRFDAIRTVHYNFDSAAIHVVDLGYAAVPGRRSYIKNGVKYYKDVYYYTHIFLYEMNKNKASGHILKGIKDKEMEKVRWVHLRDVLKTNIWPATMVVFNVFMRYWTERYKMTLNDVYWSFTRGGKDDVANS